MFYNGVVAALKWKLHLTNMGLHCGCITLMHQNRKTSSMNSVKLGFLRKVVSLSSGSKIALCCVTETSE